jgi:hypothetical protein
MDLRTAKAICLPLSWLEFYERENGCKITEVAIEVNSVLKISPILPKKAVECASHE